MKKNKVGLTVLTVFLTASAMAQVNTTVTALLVPEQPSPNWSVACAKALADIQTGTLRTSAPVTNPTDYVACGHTVAWHNFAYSEDLNAHEWGGELNPAAPFNGEYGQTVWFAIKVQDQPGHEGISLSQIEAASFTADRALNATNTFAANSYSALAIGLHADAVAPVTSGASDQKVNTVILFFRSPLFNGGSTANGLTQIRNYILSQGNYQLNVYAGIAGDPSTRGSTFVSTATINVEAPDLHVAAMNTLRIRNANASLTYNIQSRTNWSGAWQNEGFFTGITGTNDIVIPFKDSFRVFRASVR